MMTCTYTAEETTDQEIYDQTPREFHPYLNDPFIVGYTDPVHNMSTVRLMYGSLWDRLYIDDVELGTRVFQEYEHEEMAAAYREIQDNR